MTRIFSTLTLLWVVLLSGCSQILSDLNPTLPTKSRMVGLWEVTGLYDDSNRLINIIDTISLGYDTRAVPTYVYLTEDQDMQSTAGPLFLYIVYGLNNWTTFFGKLDQVFDYANAKAFTNGQWGIEAGVVDNFTIEAKIMPPSMQTFASILDLIPGLNTDQLKKYIVHRFINVAVTFESSNGDTMIWEMTDATGGYYYTQNAQLEQELWSGWSAYNFSRCRIVFERRIGTLEQKIEEFSGP
ncbi:MAG: hypothetical protein GF344_14230 [Chitinivibrionales bacterium]|nr:hypothetical protein [Chitinivibrionales bacterium]MBD3357886.1 hypothetical protein [Chitinivibrionales bacterium]